MADLYNHFFLSTSLDFFRFDIIFLNWWTIDFWYLKIFIWIIFVHYSILVGIGRQLNPQIDFLIRLIELLDGILLRPNLKLLDKVWLFFTLRSLLIVHLSLHIFHLWLNHLSLQLGYKLNIKILGRHQDEADQAGTQQNRLDVEGPLPPDVVLAYCTHAVADHDSEGRRDDKISEP